MFSRLSTRHHNITFISLMVLPITPACAIALIHGHVLHAFYLVVLAFAIAIVFLVKRRLHRTR